MNVTCCLDCKDRHLGCHGTCEKYKEMKQKLQDIKDKKNENSMQNVKSIGFIRNVKRKSDRRKR